MTSDKVGEWGTFDGFVEPKEMIGPDNSTLSLKDFLPSTARREALLDMVRAAIPLLSERQRIVLFALGQGQKYRDVARSLRVDVSIIQREVDRIRAIIKGEGCQQNGADGV